MSKPIQIVDEDDRPVGEATKQEAWDQGLIHRVVRIMIHNQKGQILLQLRDRTKDIFPGCWDNSSAGHVDVGEDYQTAAKRELKEELGLEGLKLVEIGRYRSNETWKGLHFNRFNRCYRVETDQTPGKLEADKVSAVRWFSLEEIKKLVKDHPSEITDGLRQVIERYY